MIFGISSLILIVAFIVFSVVWMWTPVDQKNDVESDNIDLFFIGSTLEQVVKVQGAPTTINCFPNGYNFYYGKSRVYIYDNKVKEYDNKDGNLKVGIK